MNELSGAFGLSVHAFLCAAVKDHVFAYTTLHHALNETTSVNI